MTNVAIVTGAAGGIGRATASALAGHGLSVICVDRRSCDDTVAEIGELGGRAMAETFDVGDESGWIETVAKATSEFGPVTVLANVAGHGAACDTALDVTDAHWDRILTTSLRGSWYGIRATLPAMIDRGDGRIVNVSSTAGLLGVPNTFAYATAKGGLIAMTRQVAAEYGRFGVRCNVVAPGATLTPGLELLPTERLQALAADSVIGRLGQPEEVAAMIAFLCSDAGLFSTGAVFTIDGGVVACGTDDGFNAHIRSSNGRRMTR